MKGGDVVHPANRDSVPSHALWCGGPADGHRNKRLACLPGQQQEENLKAEQGQSTPGEKTAGLSRIRAENSLAAKGVILIYRVDAELIGNDKQVWAQVGLIAEGAADWNGSEGVMKGTRWVTYQREETKQRERQSTALTFCQLCLVLF